MYIKYKELKDMCKENQFLIETFEEYPCQTQSVQQCLKIKTEAAMKNCGDTARDGCMHANLEAREELLFDS